MVDLTISIVNHNNCKLLGPLLASIREHTQRISYETYVVDNDSRDGSVEMIRSQYPWVNLICNEAPKGFAANHNQILQHARGRYVVLLNDDMLLQNNALDRLVAFMDANSDVGAAGCKLLNHDGTLQRSCWRGFPSPRTLFIELFYLSKWLPKLPGVQAFEATLDNTGGPVEVDYLLGACLMVRRETLDQVGPLDESYFMFLEETDWCYRIKSHGWRVFWVPDGEIIHYGQQSVSKDPVRFVPMLYRNYCLFYRKHGAGYLAVLRLRGVIALGTLFRATLWAYRSILGHPNSGAMFRGYLAAFRAMLSS